MKETMRALGLAAVMAWAGIANAIVIRICCPSDANATAWDNLNAYLEAHGSSARVRYGQSTYADGTPLAVGERLRCVAVASNYSTPTAEEKAAVIETVPLKVNLFGEVIPTGVLEGNAVVDLRSVSMGPASTPSYVGSEGYPACTTATLAPVSGLLEPVEGDEPGELWNYAALRKDEYGGRAFYVFLIVEDTRDASGAPVSGSDTCSAYAVFPVMKSLIEPKGLSDAALESFAYSPYLLAGGTSPSWPDTDGYGFVQPAVVCAGADLESVADEALVAWVADVSGGACAPQTRAEAEACLTPVVAGWTAAEGGLRLTLAQGSAEGRFASAAGPDLPDRLRYTLYTADALDGPWEPLDEWAAKKNLANFGELSYTSLRLSELQSRVLPVAEDEKTRFYKLENAR